MKKNEVLKYIKKNDYILYKQFSKEIDNPTGLLNSIIKHYQWIFQIRDFSSLNLQDRYNKNYLNLFIYALESSEELMDEFFNYFTNCFRIAYNNEIKEWNLDLIFNLLIHRSRDSEFDLISMYILIGSTYNRIRDYIKNTKVNEKIGFDGEVMLQLFDNIVDQEFYDEVKVEILNKRSNSFYHK